MLMDDPRNGRAGGKGSAVAAGIGAARRRFLAEG